MHAVHFFGQERGLPVGPVTEKESMREGKRRISPRMKYGHANLSSLKLCVHCTLHAHSALLDQGAKKYIIGLSRMYLFTTI